MTITKYDYDLGRLVYPGATRSSACPHGWTERCPHCMAGEINHLRVENDRLKSELLQSPLGTLQGVSEDDLARVLYEAEYCGETYPWEKQSSTEQLTYKSQAEAALRKFVIRHPDTRPVGNSK